MRRVCKHESCKGTACTCLKPWEALLTKAETSWERQGRFLPSSAACRQCEATAPFRTEWLPGDNTAITMTTTFMLAFQHATFSLRIHTSPLFPHRPLIPLIFHNGFLFMLFLQHMPRKRHEGPGQDILQEPFHCISHTKKTDKQLNIPSH